MKDADITDIEGTPAELSRALRELPKGRRYRIVEVPNRTGETATRRSPHAHSGIEASLALLESWIAEAPTDPDEIKAAKEELNDFKRNMNRWRKEAGARILYPEVE